MEQASRHRRRRQEKEMERKARGGRDTRIFGCQMHARPCDASRQKRMRCRCSFGTHTATPARAAAAQPRAAFEDADTGAPTTSTGRFVLCPPLARAPASREGQSFPFSLAPLPEDQTTSKSATRDERVCTLAWQMAKRLDTFVSCFFPREK